MAERSPTGVTQKTLPEVTQKTLPEVTQKTWHYLSAPALSSLQGSDPPRVTVSRGLRSLPRAPKFLAAIPDGLKSTSTKRKGTETNRFASCHSLVVWRCNTREKVTPRVSKLRPTLGPSLFGARSKKCTTIRFPLGNCCMHTILFVLYTLVWVS